MTHIIAVSHTMLLLSVSHAPGFQDVTSVTVGWVLLPPLREVCRVWWNSREFLRSVFATAAFLALKPGPDPLSSHQQALLVWIWRARGPNAWRQPPWPPLSQNSSVRFRRTSSPYSIDENNIGDDGAGEVAAAVGTMPRLKALV
jgi:hypothetical protein